MRLKSLYLHNFRPFEERLFEFGSQANLFVGENASGKTTILEAIHFLMTGKSFRTIKPQELVRFGQEGFFLEARFEKKGVLQRLRIGLRGGQRKVICNNTPHTTLSSVLGFIQGVVLTPDDASLVKDAPQCRRDFVDGMIGKSDPLFVHHSARFLRALKHRNTLLRSKRLQTIETFEAEMAKSALYIMAKRQEAVLALSKRGTEHYQEFCQGDKELTLSYKPSLLEPENYLKLLSSMRKREELFGTTLLGPHKDEVGIAIGGKEVRFFGSEGQQRSVVIALKLAEWDHLNAFAEEPPLMLLDDVYMSLDPKRQEKLFSLFELLKTQVFLTTTKQETLPFSKETAFFNLNSLTVNRELC